MEDLALFNMIPARKDTYFPPYFDFTNHHVEKPDVNGVKMIFFHRSNREGGFRKEELQPWQ